MKPTIETGCVIRGDAKDIGVTRVRFVAEDGRTMFEVEWNKDGRSINVRGVDCCKVNDEITMSALDLRLDCSNSVTIMARPWEGQ